MSYIYVMYFIIFTPTFSFHLPPGPASHLLPNFTSCCGYFETGLTIYPWLDFLCRPG